MLARWRAQRRQLGVDLRLDVAGRRGARRRRGAIAQRIHIVRVVVDRPRRRVQLRRVLV